MASWAARRFEPAFPARGGGRRWSFLLRNERVRKWGYILRNRFRFSDGSWAGVGRLAQQGVLRDCRPVTSPAVPRGCCPRHLGAFADDGRGKYKGSERHLPWVVKI